MSTAAIIAGTTAAAGLGGAAISANAAGNAASTQANAADQAAQLQYQASQNALQFQEQQYNQSQANLQPWLQGGANANTQLQYLMGIGPNPGSSTTAGGPSPIPGMPGQVSGGPSMPTGATPQVSQGSTAGPGNYGRPSPGVALPASSTPQSGAMAATPGMAQLGTLMSGQTTGNTGSAPVGGTPSQVATPAGGAAPQSQSLGGLMGIPPQGNTGATPAPSVPGAAPGTSPVGTVDPSLGGYGSLMQAYPGGSFVAPTAEEGMQSPGTQAALGLGDQALQQSAAARGSLLTGGTAEALDQFGQNLGAQNYQNTYNNAFNTYSQGYNQWSQQQAKQYNQLAALAGLGQTTASTLGTLGANASNAVSSNLLNTGSQIGQDLNNAGAANASGIVGSANAYTGGLNSIASGATNGLLLQQLMSGTQAPYNTASNTALGVQQNMDPSSIGTSGEDAGLGGYTIG